jgi:hypothetical protein
MQRTPGVVSVTAGAPRPESPTAFCIVMVWQDLQSLEAFVGGDYTSARGSLVRARSIMLVEADSGRRPRRPGARPEGLGQRRAPHALPG